MTTEGKFHAQTVVERHAEKKMKMAHDSSARFVVEKAERNPNGRVIGIDLGTTNSCMSYLDDETGLPRIIPSPTGSWVYPTAVTFDRNHSLRTFGEEARANVRTSASATLCSGKRLIGRRFGELGRVQSQLHKTNQLTINEKGDVAVEIMGRTYTVVHITAMFLRYMKLEAEKYLKEPVEAAVVSVPAYFTPQQKVATEDAALCAGFDVLEIIDEPSAACLTYTVLSKQTENASAAKADKRIHRSLVFDLGGGTLDCALMEHNTAKHTFNLVATHGDPLLGGNDWDMVLSQHFNELFEKKWKVPIEDPEGNVGQGVGAQRSLMIEAEKAKVHFTHSREPFHGYNRAFHFSEQLRDIIPLEVDLSWEEYLRLTQPLRDRCVECLDKLFAHSGFKPSDVDSVLLVGAMTRDPPIRELLQNYFQRPVTDEVACPADYAVAIGAAVRGGMLQGKFPQLSAKTRFVSGTVQAQRTGNPLMRFWSSIVSMRNVNANAIGTRWRGVAKGLSDQEIADYAKELVEFEANCARRRLLDRVEQEANFVMKRVSTDSNKRQGMQDKRIKQLTDQLKFWQYMVHNFHDHEEHLERTVKELGKAMDDLEGVNADVDDSALTESGTIDIAKAFNKLRGHKPTSEEEPKQEEDYFAKVVREHKERTQAPAKVQLPPDEEVKPFPQGPKVLRREVPLPKAAVAGKEVAEVGHPIFVGQDVHVPERTRAAYFAHHVEERSWREPPKPPGEEGSWREVQEALAKGDLVGAPLLSTEGSRPMTLDEQLEELKRSVPIDAPHSEEHAALRDLGFALGTMTIVDPQAGRPAPTPRTRPSVLAGGDQAAPS